jgi:hypothetical protein
MKAQRLYLILILAQGSYLLSIGLWVLLDSRSFIALTGFQEELWMLKTVSVLWIVISLTLFFPLFTNSNTLHASFTGALTSLALLLVDLYYYYTGPGNDAYLADAVVEASLLSLWLYVLIRNKMLW